MSQLGTNAYTDEFVLEQTNYIPSDLDGDHKDAIYKLQYQSANLYARMFFELYTKLEDVLASSCSISDLFYNANPKTVDEFTDYVNEHLGGLDDEFYDYNADLKDFIKDNNFIESTNFLLNRYQYASKMLADAACVISSSPTDGHSSAKLFKKVVEAQYATSKI